MEHLSPDELHDRLATAAKQVSADRRYRHYKGQTYTVLQLAIIEETNEPAVIYRADYDPRLIFIRPVSVWLEQVEYRGRTVPRFEPISN